MRLGLKQLLDLSKDICQVHCELINSLLQAVRHLSGYKSVRRVSKLATGACHHTISSATLACQSCCTPSVSCIGPSCAAEWAVELQSGAGFWAADRSVPPSARHLAFVAYHCSALSDLTKAFSLRSPRTYCLLCYAARSSFLTASGSVRLVCRINKAISTVLLLSLVQAFTAQPCAAVLPGQRLRTPAGPDSWAPSLSGLPPHLHGSDDFALHLPPALPGASSQSLSQQGSAAFLEAFDTPRNVSRRRLLAPPRPEFGKYTDLEVPKELNTPIECKTGEGYTYEGRVLQSGNTVKMSDMDHCRKACK